MTKHKKVHHRPGGGSTITKNLAARREELNGLIACARELDLMAHILTVHDAHGIGPGRAEKDLQVYRVQSEAIFDLINDDGKVDRDLSYSMKVLADRLKAILGPENWRKYQANFPLLRDYWEEEE